MRTGILFVLVVALPAQTRVTFSLTGASEGTDASGRVVVTHAADGSFVGMVPVAGGKPEDSVSLQPGPYYAEVDVRGGVHASSRFVVTAGKTDLDVPISVAIGATLLTGVALTSAGDPVPLGTAIDVAVVEAHNLRTLPTVTDVRVFCDEKGRWMRAHHSDAPWIYALQRAAHARREPFSGAIALRNVELEDHLDVGRRRLGEPPPPSLFLDTPAWPSPRHEERIHVVITLKQRNHFERWVWSVAPGDRTRFPLRGGPARERLRASKLEVVVREVRHRIAWKEVTGGVIRVPGILTVTGRVRLPTGVALRRGFEVQHPEGKLQADFDVAGRFVIRGALPGPCRLRVSTLWAQLESDPFVVRGKQDREDVGVIEVSGWREYGVPADVEGRSTVRLVSAKKRMGRRWRALDRLTERRGDQWIVRVPPGWRDAEWEVEIVDGGTAERRSLSQLTELRPSRVSFVDDGFVDPVSAKGVELSVEIVERDGRWTGGASWSAFRGGETDLPVGHWEVTLVLVHAVHGGMARVPLGGFEVDGKGTPTELRVDSSLRPAVMEALKRLRER